MHGTFHAKLPQWMLVGQTLAFLLLSFASAQTPPPPLEEPETNAPQSIEEISPAPELSNDATGNIPDFGDIPKELTETPQTAPSPEPAPEFEPRDPLAEPDLELDLEDGLDPPNMAPPTFSESDSPSENAREIPPIQENSDPNLEEDLEEIRKMEAELNLEEIPDELPPSPTKESPKEEKPIQKPSLAELRHKHRVPAFHNLKPNWGFQLAAGFKAFSNNKIVESQSDETRIYAATLQIEYQPSFLQAIGVVGLGPAISIYPNTPSNELTTAATSIYSFGGQVRYQARLFREQFIVPMVSYHWELFNYRFKDANSGRFMINGASVGLWVLLNAFEPSAAAEFYADQGILRSYLVAEYRDFFGSDDLVSVEGKTYYFGVRIEY